MNNNFQVPFTQFQVHRNMVYGTQVIEQVIKVERGEKGLEVKLCNGEARQAFGPITA